MHHSRLWHIHGQLHVQSWLFWSLLSWASASSKTRSMASWMKSVTWTPTGLQFHNIRTIGFLIRQHPFFSQVWRCRMFRIQMVTMGSRPSLATASQAWGLRRTLRRSSPPSHLCSTLSLSIGLQTPINLYRKQIRTTRAPNCMPAWPCSTPCVCAYLVVVCCSSKGEVWWRATAMSRGAEP